VAVPEHVKVGVPGEQHGALGGADLGGFEVFWGVKSAIFGVFEVILGVFEVFFG
jgi:hypothetical protein